MKSFQTGDMISITLDESDIAIISNLKSLLKNIRYIVRFSNSFTRYFYTKPLDKLDLTIKAPACTQPKFVGAWFDTLLKLYIPLSHQFGYNKNNLKCLVKDFKVEELPQRWWLVNSFFIVKDGSAELSQGAERRYRWCFSDVTKFYERLNAYPEYTKKLNAQILSSHEIFPENSPEPVYFTADSINDLCNLIDLINEDDLKFDHLYLAHQFIGGKPIDLVLDDVLIDIKTTTSTTLKIDYFDQLVGYYIMFKLWQELYPFPILSLKNYEVNHLGVYFARSGYLYKMPVSQVINMDKLHSFLARQS